MLCRLTSLLILTLIVETFLATEISANTDNNSIIFNIIPLDSSISAGKSANFIILLPSKDAEKTKWALYDNSSLEYSGGDLNTEPIIQHVKITYSTIGTHKIVLILKDKYNNPKLIKIAEIKVDENIIMKLFFAWGGTVLGALIAIIVFLIQNILSETKRKKIFKNKYKIFLADLYNKIVQNQRVEAPPNWINNTGDSEWADIISLMDYDEDIFAIQKIFYEIKMGIFEKNTALVELRRLKKKTAPRFSYSKGGGKEKD